MGEDPQAPNYDPQHRIIRSFFNGTRGPLLRQATALDWAGDPIEVEGRFRPGHGEQTYEEMLEHFRDYTDVVGDHPMNLGATTLAFTAYALTGEAKYRDWVLEYVDAWVERTDARTTACSPPASGRTARSEPVRLVRRRLRLGLQRAARSPGTGASRTAMRLRPRRLRLRQRPAAHRRAALRRPLAADARPGQRQPQETRTAGRCTRTCTVASTAWSGCSRAAPSTTCRRKGRRGGTSTGRSRSPPGRPSCTTGRSTARCSTSCRRRRPGCATWTARTVVPRSAPCRRTSKPCRRKVARMRADARAPDTTLSDDPNPVNPATTDALVRLMLGGLPVGRNGYPLHCRLRYFDPARRRAGLPEQVGALVERMTEDEVTVQLVNLDPLSERTVIVQGGAYAEHQLTTVRQSVTPGRRPSIIRTSRSGSRRAPEHVRRGYAALCHPTDTQPPLGVASMRLVPDVRTRTRAIDRRRGLGFAAAGGRRDRDVHRDTYPPNEIPTKPNAGIIGCTRSRLVPRQGIRVSPLVELQDSDPERVGPCRVAARRHAAVRDSARRPRSK